MVAMINNTIQLNNEKQQRNAIGTQYTENSLAYIIVFLQYIVIKSNSVSQKLEEPT